MRTAFNLLGSADESGRSDGAAGGRAVGPAAELMADALATLGLQRGFVVHGLDGLDEITTTAETVALEIRGGAIAHMTLRPEDFGVERADAAEI